MNKRFTIEIIEDKDVFIHQDGAMHFLGVNGYVNGGMVVDLLNNLYDENEQLKQQKIDLLRLIENNIEIYENINTNVEFHKGEIQGKLTVLNNLRKVILND